MNIDSPYVQWIGFLHLTFNEIKEGGSLLVAEDVFEQDSKQIARFPLVKGQPYFDFVADVFNLKIEGVEEGDINDYAQCAVSMLEMAPPENFDSMLLHCIWNTLLRFFKEDHFTVACEFGRASIPYTQRPDREAFHRWLSELTKPETVKNFDELYVRADAFVDAVNR